MPWQAQPLALADETPAINVNLNINRDTHTHTNKLASGRAPWVVPWAREGRLQGWQRQRQGWPPLRQGQQTPDKSVGSVILVTVEIQQMHRRCGRRCHGSSRNLSHSVRASGSTILVVAASLKLPTTTTNFEQPTHLQPRGWCRSLTKLCYSHDALMHSLLSSTPFQSSICSRCRRSTSLHSRRHDLRCSLGIAARTNKQALRLVKKGP